jgi:uncharacterized membrane protein YjjP (DUF1212 family)/uncharacterized membrane protein YjjB (DUF3815 family)
VAAAAAAAGLVVLALLVGSAGAHAQPAAETAPSFLTSADAGVGDDEAPTTAPATGEAPGETPTDDPDPDQEPDDPAQEASEPEIAPTDEQTPAPTTSSQVPPSVRSSDIPVSTVLLAVAVLAAVGVAAYMVRRAGPRELGSAQGTTDASAPLTTRPPSTSAPADDREVISFLLELGQALVDAGEAVDRIHSMLRTIAEREGLRDTGIVVLPTALIISAPGRDSLQTDVTAAGNSPLRLDQVAAVLRIVDDARDGLVSPAEGRARLAAIRSSPSPISGRAALAGHALTTVGLALILRGGIVEVCLAGVLGVAAGALQLAAPPRRASFRPFLPPVAAFVVATAVFLALRVAPELAIVPPLVAPLIPFLPGGLLTVGTLELATGQAVSGVARLGSGGIQLILLAGGIVGAAQFVGIPGPADAILDTAAASPSTVVEVLAPWVGVAVFGLGLAGSRAAPRPLLPWILLVLYVAYAAQIIGGLFFGTGLSGFFGALAMTPVAVYASRQPQGPPALVAFLPAFWLLVPGALGLEGVTRILGDRGVQGVDALVTTGSAMVSIALGILLGLLLAAPETWRLRGRSDRDVAGHG